MLEIFRKNLFFNSLLLLPYTCVLRINSLISPKAYELHAEDGYLNHLIFTLLEDRALWQSIIGIILVFFQATFINYIVNKNRITSIPNLLPGLSYVVLISAIPAFQILNPVLIAITFLFISINSLFKCANKFSNAGKIFNISFFISLASHFYFPFWIFLLAGYIGLVTIRSFKIGERLQYMFGAIIPYFLLSTYYNWYGTMTTYLTAYLGHNTSLSNITRGFNNYQLIVIGLFVGLAIFSFFKYNDFRKKKTVAAQKKIDILYWFLFLTIPTMFFWKNLGLDHFIILLPPLAVFFGMFLLKIKNRLLAELIHLTSVLLIFFTQFQFGG